jgi:hypothetical protein
LGAQDTDVDRQNKKQHRKLKGWATQNLLKKPGMNQHTGPPQELCMPFQVCAFQTYFDLFQDKQDV